MHTRKKEKMKELHQRKQFSLNLITTKTISIVISPVYFFFHTSKRFDIWRLCWCFLNFTLKLSICSHFVLHIANRFDSPNPIHINYQVRWNQLIEMTNQQLTSSFSICLYIFCYFYREKKNLFFVVVVVVISIVDNLFK